MLADTQIDVSPGLKKQIDNLVKPCAILGNAQQTRVRRGDERRQTQRSTDAIDPRRIGFQLAANQRRVAGCTRDPRVTRGQIGMLRQQPRRRLRPGAVRTVRKILGIDQPAKSLRQNCGIASRHTPRIDVSLEIGP